MAPDPFATDALVFVVNADNPVNGLTTEQLQKIYTGRSPTGARWGARTGTSSPSSATRRQGSQALMKKLVMDPGEEEVPQPGDYTAGSMSSLLEGAAV